MVEPGSFSCGAHRYKLGGNLKLAAKIRQMAENALQNRETLYDAQEKIKQFCLREYGVDWYAKSEEAIQYIIEDAYASEKRENSFRGFLW